MKEIADFTREHHVPAISMFYQFADVGGLMAYGVRQDDFLRPLARYVDKLLKGAKADELPIERPTTYELVINLKTAKTLGLSVPPTLLARATRVIE